jgi:tetratricopeptide (TPR) repeat protein
MRERAKGSAYLGEVAVTDDALGTLFTRLRESGELAHTTVIVVGDHGESLGQHGEATHGTFVYDSTLRVPLIVRRADGARAGERSEAIVSVVDVAPTALAALGLAAPAEIDGLDLAQPVPAERGVYFESYEAHLGFDASPLAGWVDASAKYLHSSQPELYDTNVDARERKNRIAEREADVERYRAAIAAVWARPTLPLDAGGAIDPALRAELRELGYTGLEAPSTRLESPLASSDRPSPAELADVIQRFWEATDQAYAGNYTAAIEVLAEIAVRHPRSALVATTLADYLIQLEHCAEAEPLLRRLIENGDARASTFHSLGLCRERAGDLDAAARNFARALELDPGHPGARESFERVRAKLQPAGK